MIYQLINNLPSQAKSSVLYSLVGSLNASILYGAQAIVRECDRMDDDVHEEICTGFLKTGFAEKMKAELGTGVDRWLELQAMNALRAELSALLSAERNVVEEVVPLHGTLQFMTQSVRELPQQQLEELVAALNIEGLTVASIKTVYKADAELRRQDLAGMSERVLSVALAIPEFEGYDEDSAFYKLSPAKQCILLEKVEAALNKARNNVVLGVLQRRAIDLGDIPLIQQAIKEVQVMLRNTREDAPRGQRTEHSKIEPEVIAPPVYEKAIAPRGKKMVKVGKDDLANAYHAVH